MNISFEYLCCIDQGLVINDFTDLSYFSDNCESVSHKGAADDIQRQIDVGLQFAREGFFEKYEAELKTLEIESADDVSYHDLEGKGRSDLAEEFSEYERENLSDDSSSIMYQVRFMYHGTDEKGNHTASVSCAVNTEGPYHRSSISWMPGVFCEGAKEVEIGWKTEKQLQTRLAKTLKDVSAEIF